MALHVGHDGDSIASNLALLRVLHDHQHHVDLVTREIPHANFSFLPGFAHIRHISTEKINWADYDVFWALDMASAGRSSFDWPFSAELDILVIDHHHSNKGWGTSNLVDSMACSTTAVLYRLFAALDLHIDAELATCLLTGIATDTDFFASSAAAGAFASAAELVEKGADYQEIQFCVRQCIGVEALKALGTGLHHIEVYTNPAFAILRVPHDSAIPSPLFNQPELLTAFAWTVDETDFGAVLLEQEPNRIRIELRARKPGVDVSSIALRLGGGGHQSRAGAEINANFEEAIAAIRHAARGNHLHN